MALISFLLLFALLSWPVIAFINIVSIVWVVFGFVFIFCHIVLYDFITYAWVISPEMYIEPLNIAVLYN